MPWVIWTMARGAPSGSQRYAVTVRSALGKSTRPGSGEALTVLSFTACGHPLPDYGCMAGNVLLDAVPAIIGPHGPCPQPDVPENDTSPSSGIARRR